MRAQVVARGLVVLLAFHASTVFGGALPDGPYVSTSASVEIELEADSVEIRVSGRASADANEQARASSVALQQQLRDALQPFEKAIAPIVLDQINATERSTYDPERGGHIVVGYDHEFSVVIRVHGLDVLDALFDRLSSVNGLEVRSPEFFLRDYKAGEAQARDAALAEARSEAEALARSQGARLGRIWGIVYRSTHDEADPINWSGLFNDLDYEEQSLDRVAVTGSRYEPPIRIDPKRVVFSAQVGVVYELLSEPESGQQ